VSRHCDGGDFMPVGIDAEMQFAPTPRGWNIMLLVQLFALAINLQTSAVDEKMERFVTANRLCRMSACLRRLNVVWAGIAMSMSSRARIDRSSPSVRRTGW